MWKFLQGSGRFEPYYFVAVVLVNLIPVLSVEYFPTVDGPAHLYNARLILELWKDPSCTIAEYLEFNQNAISNWSGHLLLSVLLFFTSTIWAEKVMLLLYLIGFPLGVRYLAKSFGIKRPLMLYLIFPFTYSFLFYYGFYNFQVGIVLFFFGVGLWIRKGAVYSGYNFVLFSIVSVLISLSHVFVFILFLISLSILALWKVLNEGFSIRHLLFQFACHGTGLIITAFFLFSEDTLQMSKRFVPWGDILISLKYVMPIKGIEPVAYDPVSKILLYTFSILVIASGIGLWRSGSRSIKNIMIGGEWMGLCLVTLAMLFFVPDYMGTAGFITARLMWFLFIFFIIWLSFRSFPKWLIVGVFLVANGVTFWSVNHNFKAISKASSMASELVEISKLVEPNSTVLPVTVRETRPFIHVVNYLGVERPLILLYNYEAALTYFPLRWKYENIAEQYMGNMGSSNCISWVGGKRSDAKEQIEYVCMVTEPGVSSALACENKLTQNLEQSYERIYINSDAGISLYRTLAQE